MRNLDITDTRDKLGVYADRPAGRWRAAQARQLKLGNQR